MNQDDKNYFSDANNCRKTILEARELFVNRNTTRKEYENMIKILGMALLNCPPELEVKIHQTIQEATQRRAFFELHIWSPPQQKNEDTAEDWNRKYPVGQPVSLLEDDGTMTQTKTRSIAWSIGPFAPLVKVEGKSGGYSLTRIQPR